MSESAEAREERRLLDFAADNYDPANRPTVAEVMARLKPKLDLIDKAARQPLPRDLIFAPAPMSDEMRYTSIGGVGAVPARMMNKVIG